ncbi:MAG: repeat-containing protein, partial [Daejeonella sp.]|nr:repeat-containing protein [Daejeonella sp.]
VLNIKGLSFYFLKELEKSLDCFKMIIESGRKDEVYARAILNFGSISLNSGKENYKDEAVKIFNAIINETGLQKEKLKPEIVSELKGIAHYNLAQLQSNASDFENAIENYKNAIFFVKPSTKPTIILALYKIADNYEFKEELLTDLIRLIEEGLVPLKEDLERPIDFNYDEFKEIVAHAFLSNNETLFLRLKPFLNILGDQPLSALILTLAMYHISGKGDQNIAKDLLKNLHTNSNNWEIDAPSKLVIIKLLAYLTSPTIDIDNKYHIEYALLLEQNISEPITSLDLKIFFSLINNLIKNKKYTDGLRFMRIISGFASDSPESMAADYIAIYHLELNLYYHFNDKINLEKKANELLKKANNIKKNKLTSSLLGEKGLDIVIQNATEMLATKIKLPSSLMPISKSYSRNDKVKVRYKDGTILESKFKKIQQDLEAGECFILN